MSDCEPQQKKQKTNHSVNDLTIDLTIDVATSVSTSVSTSLATSLATSLDTSVSTSEDTNLATSVSTSEPTSLATVVIYKNRFKIMITNLYELNMISLKSLFSIGISKILIDLYVNKLSLSNDNIILPDNDLIDEFKLIAESINICNSNFLKNISNIGSKLPALNSQIIMKLITVQNELLNEIVKMIFLTRILQLRVIRSKLTSIILRDMLNSDIIKFSEKLEMFKSQICEVLTY
jgi:hypothetical protein